MRAGYTDLTAVLDRSGSMASIASDMEGGFNTFIAEQRKLPGELRVSLMQFDDQAVEWVYEGNLVGNVPPLVLLPRGGTPLWDAVGRAVTQTGERLAKMPEALRPERVLVMVVTDGLENRSQEWTAAQVRDLIKRQRETYKWDFMFLGANIDSFAVGGQMGVAQANAANYRPTGESIRGMMVNSARKVAEYRSASSLQEASASLAYTDADRAEIEGKTPKPTLGLDTTPEPTP